MQETVETAEYPASQRSGAFHTVLTTFGLLHYQIDVGIVLIHDRGWSSFN